jgi:hypothetical protein
MILQRPPSPLPSPLVWFYCPDCNRSVSFTRDELDKTSVMAQTGVTIWRRRCPSCDGMMRRITARPETPVHGSL